MRRSIFHPRLAVASTEVLTTLEKNSLKMRRGEDGSLTVAAPIQHVQRVLRGLRGVRVSRDPYNPRQTVVASARFAQATVIPYDTFLNHPSWEVVDGTSSEVYEEVPGGRYDRGYGNWLPAQRETGASEGDTTLHAVIDGIPIESTIEWSHDGEWFDYYKVVSFSPAGLLLSLKGKTFPAEEAITDVLGEMVDEVI